LDFDYVSQISLDPWSSQTVVTYQMIDPLAVQTSDFMVMIAPIQPSILSFKVYQFQLFLTL
jgi:hypothetical protein